MDFPKYDEEPSFCASDIGSICATFVGNGTYNVSFCATLKNQVTITLSLKNKRYGQYT